MHPTPPPPITEPDPSAPTCLGSQADPCAACRRTTHKYGHGGMPPCPWCAAPVLHGWAPTAGFTSTRA
ncbi:hypothetical protein JHN59_11180 [Streptomyces sp. MBT49]|uniref:hypothetical protein n=1 Tax=Streptomyces TaxID=1883 RepID=UPI00190CBAE5|nr:hypothetical protein [Streptomyces sp. MBT49]MBK3625402.1 hypothetical protein [Streptomyces sp. MBT49]